MGQSTLVTAADVVSELEVALSGLVKKSQVHTVRPAKTYAVDADKEYTSQVLDEIKFMFWQLLYCMSGTSELDELAFKYM